MAIDPRAIVSPDARLEGDVEVGPFAVIGPGVVLRSGVRVGSHVVLEGPLEIGAGAELFPFAVVGMRGQSRGDEASCGVVIGERVTLREHVTVHGGTRRATRVGPHTLVMAGAHVGHDAQVGAFCTFSNAVQIAGHAVIEDHVTIGGLAAVAQLVTVGESAFLAGGAMCEADVPPFVIAQGDRARVRALNVVGLRRRGFDEASIRALRRALGHLRFGDGDLASRVAALLGSSDPYVMRLARSFGGEPRAQRLDEPSRR